MLRLSEDTFGNRSAHTKLRFPDSIQCMFATLPGDAELCSVARVLKPYPFASARTLEATLRDGFIFFLFCYWAKSLRRLRAVVVRPYVSRALVAIGLDTDRKSVV